MNDIKENNTGYKLSRVDFEVEKLKLQADLELAEKRGENVTSYVGLSVEKGNASWIFKNYPVEEIERGILEKWSEFSKYSAFETIPNILLLDDDEVKLRFYEKLREDNKEKGRDEDGGEYGDAWLLSSLIASLDDDELKKEYLKKISECTITGEHGGVFIDDSDIDALITESKEEGSYIYTEEECEKILRDRYMANVIATLENPDTMMEYYREMKDVYAKEFVIDAIQEFLVYSRQLTMEELQEVSARMKEEVVQAETLNAQTRKALEEEIMASLRQLTKAKQEYARLTQNATRRTNEEDSFDLE